MLVGELHSFGKASIPSKLLADEVRSMQQSGASSALKKIKNKNISLS